MDQKDFAKLFKLLAAKHDENREFRFLPRLKNTKQRLSQGFLLGGNSNYIAVGLVDSRSWRSKSVSVNFYWTPNNCGITFIWRTGDDDNIKTLIDKVLEKMPEGTLSERVNSDVRREYTLDYSGTSMEEAVTKLEQFCITILYPAIRDLTFDYLLDFPEKVERKINEGKRRVDGILNGTEAIPAIEITDDDTTDDQDSENEVIEETIELNTILYGPPGTGKTYNTVIYAVAICEGKKIEEVANEPYSMVKERYDNFERNGRIAFTTFHQSYGYEDFIEGIKPVVDNGTAAPNNAVNANSPANLKYKIEDGVFKKFCNSAGNETKVFIIDEINRGNISKIFGELITLIEKNKRKGCPEGKPAILPYTKQSFAVPNNIYILGTMNTADRSIALMDTALRRRFRFVEMMPKTNLVDLNVVHQDKSVNVKLILDKINERIEYLYDREHTIGHAFFIPLKSTEESKRFSELTRIFSKEIIPLLQEYFYEDYEKIRLVLGDNAKNEDNQFVLCEDKNARNVFNISRASDGDSLPDDKKIYSINEDAFGNIDSYIGIYENAR